jgi:hypothetical protein
MNPGPGLQIQKTTARDMWGTQEQEGQRGWWGQGGWEDNGEGQGWENKGKKEDKGQGRNFKLTNTYINQNYCCLCWQKKKLNQ